METLHRSKKDNLAAIARHCKCSVNTIKTVRETMTDGVSVVRRCDMDALREATQSEMKKKITARREAVKKIAVSRTKKGDVEVPVAGTSSRFSVARCGLQHCDLKRIATEEWEKLDVNQLNNLVMSFRERLLSVIRHRGRSLATDE